MEMIFVFTHLVMIICSAGIIYMSIAFGSKNEEEEEKKPAIPDAENPKPIQVAAGYLEAFAKITS
ncbi:hypothetical protein ACPPVU_21125 [Mucilaginibacter sp. McL0603]|uniref:hypothetical protein n=1 Tax=Mucilaginibacter sp. McL0603 TaxID=3415670 RepID=UPI003CED1D26